MRKQNKINSTDKLDHGKNLKDIEFRTNEEMKNIEYFVIKEIVQNNNEPLVQMKEKNDNTTKEIDQKNNEYLVQIKEKDDNMKKEILKKNHQESSDQMKELVNHISKNKEVQTINLEEKILTNIVSTTSQKTYTSYSKQFANYLIEYEVNLNDEEEQIDFLVVISNFLNYYQSGKEKVATSTWRGIINGIIYFFNSNNLLISKELKEGIKKLETSIQNTQIQFNRKNQIYQKKAKLIKPQHLIEIFSKLSKNTYLERRNLGVYTLLTIGTARSEMLEKLNYFFIEFLENDEVKVNTLNLIYRLIGNLVKQTKMEVGIIISF
jgi:hypothetical protein